MSKPHESSFRDPSGYVTEDGGTIRRVINPIYFPQYQKLTDSGFFQKLFKAGLLIPHREISKNDGRIVIEPEQIPFITYPYEWSFEQYRHAALTTLKIHRQALSTGFTLKDASAFNITFHKGKPVFMDTLSFDFYKPGTPWRAYKQFITHFFGPLVLARYHGADMLKTIQQYSDGLPVELISSLLPRRTKFSPTLYSNIHLLAKLESKHREDYKAEKKVGKLSLSAQVRIVKNLYNYIQKLKIEGQTEWGDYYDKANYTQSSFRRKAELIRSWTAKTAAKRVVDMGGNDGTFGRELKDMAKQVLVGDVDPSAVDVNYGQALKNKEPWMLPFVCDVLMPSPGIGFGNTERSPIVQRLKKYEPDMVMALALIHHLTLSGNVPFERTARFFAGFSKNLIIEFPDREDSWVESLLVRKREFAGHFDFYKRANFETTFSQCFRIVEKEKITDSHRFLYLMERIDK